MAEQQFASRAFNPDACERGQWGPWRLTDYHPPRQPDRRFQVVKLPPPIPERAPGASPSAASAPDASLVSAQASPPQAREVRMLTPAECEGAMNMTAYDTFADYENVQRKFCEVNGLTLAPEVDQGAAHASTD
jgi:hypothetical protein